MNPRLGLGQAHRSAALLKRCHKSLITLKKGIELADTNSLRALAQDIDSHIAGCPKDNVPEAWTTMAMCSRALGGHFECRKMAKEGGSGLAEKTRFLSILVKEARERIPNASDPVVTRLLQGQLGENGEILNTMGFIGALLALPLPTAYFVKREERLPLAAAKSESTVPTRERPSVVKVIAFLDGRPLVTPQLIRADTIYSITFRVQGEGWPDDAMELILDLLTTCPLSTFSISPFAFQKPSILDEYSAELSGEIVFRHSQSTFAENIVFRVRCALRYANSTVQLLQPIGHAQIQLRVDSDESPMLASGYKSMDFHVTGLLQQLIKECPSVSRELRGLIPVLQALQRFSELMLRTEYLRGQESYLSPIFTRG